MFKMLVTKNTMMKGSHAMARQQLRTSQRSLFQNHSRIFRRLDPSLSASLSSLSPLSPLPSGHASHAAHASHRYFATKAEPLNAFALGGHKWTRVAQTAQSYELYVRAALEQGVTVLEAGQEGGEQALVHALRECLQSRAELFQRHPITVTSRLGYRSWSTTATAADQSGEAVASQLANDGSVMVGDVIVEEHAQGVAGSQAAAAKSASDDTNTVTTNTVVHNLSPEYIEHYLNTSPLASFCDAAGAPKITWMPMIHNPETQLIQFIQNLAAAPDLQNELPSLEERTEYLRPILHQAIQTLQASPAVKSFGLVSNGLSLPPSHPLHLSHELLLPPYGKDKASAQPKFTTVQLPANMLESNGLMVARKLKAALADMETSDDTDSTQTLDIWAMRPLTAYPVYLGTGIEQPYKLCDYPVTSIDMMAAPPSAVPTASTTDTGKHWTHQWEGPPPIYQVALQTCMSHFDADAILEAQLERDLTTDERESIDGCKLIQSMLHDLDNAMDKYNSLDVFEDDLYQRIIPLLADTFESLDETSSDVLQAFFASYAIAVRYTIAKKTRKILQEGLTSDDLVSAGKTAAATDDNDEEPPAPARMLQPTPVFPQLDAERSLQELALRHVLEEPAISRIVVGTTSQIELKETMSLVQHVMDYDTSK